MAPSRNEVDRLNDTLDQLNVSRYDLLVQKIDNLQKSFDQHVQSDANMHAQMVQIISIKASAEFGFKAMKWLAGVGAAIAAVLLYWKH